MRYLLMHLLDNILCGVFLNADTVHVLHVLSELLVRLVVSVVDGAAVEAHNASEAAVVVDGCSCGHLRTETVATYSCHGNLVLVHEPHNVI